jgi:hypothetical protein
VSTNESFALKFALDEFLKRACEIAKGDTRKCINVFEIWDNEFPVQGIRKEYAIPIILKNLMASNFAKDCNKKDEIRLTFNGIYYVVDNLKVSAENLGVLPRSDVMKLEGQFLRSLYEQTKGDPTRSVNLVDIQERMPSISGPAPIIQIAEHIRSKGLIEIDESEGPVKFRVPSKEVKKYYPPPSSPPSFSSEPFSSESFST